MLISVFQTLDHLHISNSDIQHPRGIIKATSTSIVFLDFGTLSPHLTFTSQFPPSRSKLRLFFWNQFLSKFDPYNTCTYHYLCPCQKCSKLPVNIFFLLCSPSSLVAVGFASRPSVQTLLTTLNLSLVTSTSIFGYSVLQSL